MMQFNKFRPIKKNNLPLPSIDLAVIGQQTLAAYYSKMIQASREENNLYAYQYYRHMADLTANPETGLLLGNLLYEAHRITEEQCIGTDTSILPTPNRIG